VSPYDNGQEVLQVIEGKPGPCPDEGRRRLDCQLLLISANDEDIQSEKVSLKSFFGCAYWSIK